MQHNLSQFDDFDALMEGDLKGKKGAIFLRKIVTLITPTVLF